MVNTVAMEKTEIISVASGKGGTGKTSILTSLGYAFQVSIHRVLFLDTDTATDGLSLFLLGPRGWEAVSGLDEKDGDVPIAVELRRVDVAGVNVTRPS